jgi:hypothetical protein
VLSETALAADTMLGIEPTRPELIGSADGGIERLLFTIPRYAVATDGLDGENPYAVVYRDLFSKLPSATEVVVLSHAAVSGEVGRWLDDAGLSERASVIDTDDFLGFSIWAEDGYVAIREARVLSPLRRCAGCRLRQLPQRPRQAPGAPVLSGRQRPGRR